MAAKKKKRSLSYSNIAYKENQGVVESQNDDLSVV